MFTKEMQEALAADAEKLRILTGEDHRLILCDACDSEGRILRSNGGPDDIDCGQCPACEGKGTRIVKVEPVDEFDHIELNESGLARSNF